MLCVGEFNKNFPIHFLSTANIKNANCQHKNVNKPTIPLLHNLEHYYYFFIFISKASAAMLHTSTSHKKQQLYCIKFPLILYRFFFTFNCLIFDTKEYLYLTSSQKHASWVGVGLGFVVEYS